MSELTEFLVARIAEDEAMAWAAVSASEAHWGAINDEVVFDGEWSVARASRPVAAHIARHDPARVLAECAAKRQIVELHERKGVWVDDDQDYPACRTCGTANEYPVDWPCPTLRALASVYAGEPGWREEWA